MLDVDKDVEVEIIINMAGKRLALANLIIGGLVKVSNFEIIKAKNGKVYVINPHIISNVYNKTSCKREITYLSTASLLEHEDRKKLIDKILESYSQKLEEKRIEAQNLGGGKNISNGLTYTENFDRNPKRDYSL